MKQFALCHRGRFPVIPASFHDPPKEKTIKYLLWHDLLFKPSLGSVHWASVKSSNRALEKLLRTYDDDVSRLLDCCRQSIIFENLEELSQCFKAILQDPEITVVRVKNRFDPNYNSAYSAGYR